MKNFYFMILMFLGSTALIFAQEAEPPDVDLVEEQMDDNGGERQGTGGGVVLVQGTGGASGAQNMAIKMRMPSEGKILRKNFELIWNGKIGQSYILKIAENDFVNSEPLLEAQVQGSSMMVPLEEIAVVEGKMYTLQLSELNERTNVSKKVFFEIISPAFYKEVVKVAEGLEDFQRGTKAKQVVLKAVGFEQNGLNYDAMRTYQTYMFNDSDDIMLRNIRDKFMRRKGIEL